jgi:hypothetical protein
MAYALAALATLGAIAWVDDRPEAEAGDAVVAAVPPRGSATDSAASAVPRLARPMHELRLFAAPTANLFGTPAWERPPPAPSPPPRELAPPKPRGAPPLPYTYLGRWVENGQTQVFFTAHGRDYRVPIGGLLGIDYRLKSIDERQVVLEYLPLGVTQTLALQATITVQAKAPVRSGDGEPPAEASESN